MDKKTDLSQLDLTRRKLLTLIPTLAPLAGLSLYSTPLFSQAPETSDHFFCYLIMEGGCDATLGLDPWIQEKRLDPQDIFIEYTPNEVTSTGGLYLGPSAAPLKPFADRISVFNGVFMSLQDNGHPAAMSYITTGNPTGLRPDISVEIADSRGAGPFGVISNQSLSTKQSQCLVSSSRDIASLKDKSNPASFFQLLFSTFKNPTSNWSKTVTSLLNGNSTFDALKAELIKLSANNPNLEPEHVAAACFSSLACSEAQINISQNIGGLDTHAQHVGTHKRIQLSHWEKVASIFSLFQSLPFKDSNLFEHTTFMVASEFSRTAALNAANGKDHNPLTNSVLLAGRGVRGNQTIGGSKVVTRQDSSSGDSYLIALPWDFQQQKLITQPSEGTPHMIYPENVVRTLVEILKINPQSFKSVPAETNFFPQAVL